MTTRLLPRHTVVALVCAATLVLASCGDDQVATDTTTTTSASTTQPIVTAPPDTAYGERIWVFALGPGECFDERLVPGQGSTEVETLFRVECSGAHDNEIFHVTSMPNPVTDPYPGDDAVLDFADRTCAAEMAAFVGVPYEISAFELGYLHPTEGSWYIPDRQVVCFVFHYEGEQLVGTARGSRLCAVAFQGSEENCAAYVG